jgi:Ca2+/Na+ antiporter
MPSRQERAMSDSAESVASLLAALLVLFSAMLDPRISVALAAVALLILAGYHWYAARGTHPWH